MRHPARGSARRDRLVNLIATSSIAIVVALGLAACGSQEIDREEKQRLIRQVDQPVRTPKKNSSGQWYVTCGLPEYEPRPRQPSPRLGIFRDNSSGHRRTMRFTTSLAAEGLGYYFVSEQWVMSDGIGWWKLYWSRIEAHHVRHDHYIQKIVSPFLERPHISMGRNNALDPDDVTNRIMSLVPAADQLVCDDRDIVS